METVRDRLWIFTCVAGSDNDSLTQAGYTQGSRMTPAEGALFLDVPNLHMIPVARPSRVSVRAVCRYLFLAEAGHLVHCGQRRPGGRG